MGHIQIRNVPEDVHRKLKARAVEQGMSLSEYLRLEVERLAALPSLADWVDQARKLPKTKLKTRPADLIRAERDRR